MSADKVTIAVTSKQTNSIFNQKITRPVELFLLFWVDEDDSGRKMFAESAQTRMENIKGSSWYDDKIHKVHCPAIQAIHEIKTITTAWINKYGGKDKAYIRENGIFSHAALDGPISVFTENIPPVPDCKCQMAIPKGWDTIDFNWTKKIPCVFSMVVTLGIRMDFHKKYLH